ncbi:ABC transporter permease [candidate division KSB1 bacterium]|nr:ABC transporter permease [candidate division KSB1 bacterium]
MIRFFIDVFEGVGIALKALARNKLRAVLTTLGIVIGVATVILMVVTILGLNRSIANQFEFLGSNTIYVSKWTWIFGEGDWRSMMKRREMKVEYAAYIEQESQLAEAVTPFAQAMRAVKFRGGTISRLPVFGVDEDYLVTNSVKIELGRFINEQDCARNRQVCVIGYGVADKLFDQVPPVGQKLDVGGKKFQVIGVNEKMGRFFGQDMDNFVLIPIGAWQKTYGRRDDMDIIVKAYDGNQTEDLKWELKGIMRRARGLEATEPDDFGVNLQTMILDFFKAITAGVYTGGILIAFISLLVGGIGIMNIMLVSVTERTSEIGLRKALGARRWQVAWQFLVEAAVICSVGGICGILLAAGGSYAMDSFIKTTMPLWVVLLGIIFSAVVGVFFGLYPALKAARLSPIEALRQE